jgi:transposase InsO family protein
VSAEEEAVARLLRRLAALGIPYMVAGSVASSRHGLPRATNDANIVVDPTPDALEALVAALAAEGYYVDARVARDALRARRGGPLARPSRQAVRLAPEAQRYLQRFRKAVMMIAFVKSMKNAPTIGTTR